MSPFSRRMWYTGYSCDFCARPHKKFRSRLMEVPHDANRIHRRTMSIRRHSHWFELFDHQLHQIELAFCRLVLCGLALYGLYKLVHVETGFSFSSSHSTEILNSAPSEISPAGQATPQGKPRRSSDELPAPSPSHRSSAYAPDSSESSSP
jgi:hypothetical protein